MFTIFSWTIIQWNGCNEVYNHGRVDHGPTYDTDRSSWLKYMIKNLNTFIIITMIWNICAYTITPVLLLSICHTHGFDSLLSFPSNPQHNIHLLMTTCIKHPKLWLIFHVWWTSDFEALQFFSMFTGPLFQIKLHLLSIGLFSAVQSLPPGAMKSTE